MRARLGAGGELFHSTPRLAADNGLMVARCAAFRLGRGEVAGPEMSALASMPFPGLIEAEA